jgi:hypothetical protein
VTKFRAILGRYWKAALSALLLPVVGNVFAGELRDLMYTWFGWKEPAWYLWLTAALTGVSFFTLAALTVFFGRDLFAPRNVALGPNINPAPHPHVVLFLSALPLKSGKFADGVPELLPLTGDLDRDFLQMTQLKDREPKDGGVRWLWEMPLRALHHHRNQLRSVTLVCSRESLPQAPWFAALLDVRYAAAFPHLGREAVRLLVHSGADVALEPCPPSTTDAPPATDHRGWDFEEYNELYDGLIGMMNVFQREGMREREVILDVTGGQKPNSVVGALLTVNRRAKFQYVQTGKANAIIAYDHVTDPAG